VCVCVYVSVGGGVCKKKEFAIYVTKKNGRINYDNNNNNNKLRRFSHAALFCMFLV
jgi:hypothetical protein